MIERVNSLALRMGAVLLTLYLPVLVADEADELSSLKQEVELLKAGQQQISKDVAAIKQLLQSLKAPQQRRQRVADVDLLMDVSQEPFKGDANAPLTLVELSDFQCPFCGRHVKKVMPEIMKNYVSTGKLRYVVRDFPLAFHKDAVKAAEAAHCAGKQDKYWEMHKLLFKNPKALGADQLPGYATQLTLDVDAFNTCLQSGEFTPKIQASQAAGKNAGVTGTPTTFLGRTRADGKVKLTKRITGAQPYAVFQQAIDALLGAKEEGAPAKAAQAEKEKAGS